MPQSSSSNQILSGRSHGSVLGFAAAVGVGGVGHGPFFSHLVLHGSRSVFSFSLFLKILPALSKYFSLHLETLLHIDLLDKIKMA